ncbi:hypothetical protein [Devosia soli]|uniref:hypothetical protein n=1 Tax=Devosia soli TaxID=361041 RepID=UPI000AC10687|nr:hypothetical protein [Devosia soli]
MRGTLPVMRLITALLAILLAVTAAHAQSGWGYYANGRYGYEVDIPPGFEGQGESDNGDGEVFLLDGRVGKLTVWGGYFALEPDFESEANARFADDRDDGWNVISQAATPGWATWSAEKSGRVIVQHMIALCDASGYAALRLEYAQTDRPRLDDLVEPLVTSFKSAC